MNIIIYKINSGQIIKSMNCPEEMIPIQYDFETENYLDIGNLPQIDDSLFYVKNNEVTARPELPVNILETTVTGLPNPTTVVTEGNSYVISDGTAELSFSLPGTYKIYLSSFPYQDKQIEVIQQ